MTATSFTTIILIYAHHQDIFILYGILDNITVDLNYKQFIYD